MSTSTDFCTHDIVLAAYLRVKGVRLNKIIRISNRGTFYFHIQPTEQSFIDGYNLGNALVEPFALNQAVKALNNAVRVTPEQPL